MNTRSFYMKKQRAKFCSNVKKTKAELKDEKQESKSISKSVIHYVKYGTVE